MQSFLDYYRNEVTFSTKDHPFSEDPKHVWVVTTFEDKWLLTVHSSRGIEFPGGKVEKGETAQDAAIREVYEETGGVVSTIHYVGQYRVQGKAETVIKNVYYAEVDHLDQKDSYMETQGPKLLKQLPDQIANQEAYSFIMKDLVLPLSISEVKRRFPSNTLM
ncbi:nucleoside triphosphatase YtkD [Paenalkalicoccus suaedae]|uniref:Nucleoside triphosphatase YtkD n=1 Tax=Paenalkalicoccus suaedae TaxID=2592382 RepID=A0A859FHK4_9BACI|nr:nucleoside triphosphatase YtkD [Paenalkalicoccus suaedae]QKS72132.1 nucleoside triphosphatase YtkD [Paenalkalicoccus suaedae]